MINRRRFVSLLATLTLAGSGAVALRLLSPGEAAFADLHSGSPAIVERDGFLHHGGHVHPGLLKDLGSATAGGATVAAHRIATDAGLATFEIEAEGARPVTAWLAGGEGFVSPPAPVVAGSHFHLETAPAGAMTLWVELETAAGREAVSFEVD